MKAIVKFILLKYCRNTEMPVFIGVSEAYRVKKNTYEGNFPYLCNYNSVLNQQKSVPMYLGVKNSTYALNTVGVKNRT